MLENLDPLLLARIQFTFTIAFHIIFPAFTIGLGVSLWPYVVPFEITIWQAAAAPESQSLLLVGTVLLLPVVLGYVGYSYYIFRGKASHETTY